MTRLGGRGMSGRMGGGGGAGGTGGAPPPSPPTVEGTTDLVNVQFDLMFDALDVATDLPNLQAVSQITALEADIDFPNVQADVRMDLDGIFDLPDVRFDVVFNSLDVATDLPNAQADIALTELVVESDMPNAQADVALTEIETATDLPNAQADVALTTLESSIDLPNVQLDVVFNALDVATDFPNVQADIAFNALEASSDFKNVQAKTNALTVEMQQNLAEKDSFVPVATTLGACNDDGNKDTQDLFVSAAALQNDARAYMAWDLSGLPTGISDATLIPTLRLKPSINGNLVGVNRTFQHIANAGEGWDETTIKCSTTPAGTDFQTATQPTGTADWAVVLDEDASIRIAARMGVGFYTVVVRDSQVGGASSTFESKDQGTNDDLGPRLTIQFDIAV
jgi:hypothetical protein